MTAEEQRLIGRVEALERLVAELRADLVAVPKPQAVEFGRIVGPERDEAMDGATAQATRGGLGRMAWEPGGNTMLTGTCNAQDEELLPFGTGEELGFTFVTDVYWEGDCLYKEFIRAVIVDGKWHTVRHLCEACVVCATDCLQLEDPECTGDE